MLKSPGWADAGKDIGAARVIVVAIGADDDSVAADGDRAAEIVACAGIGSGKLLILCPDRAGTIKDIGGAGIRVVCVVEISAYNDCVCLNSDRAAELVAGRAVGSGELLLLDPVGIDEFKDIGGAAVEAD